MNKNEFDKRYITARRLAIGLDFLHLNDVQRDAALTIRGALLLLAGAGSGKTTTLINRIANLIKFGCGSDSDYVPAEATDDDLTFLETYASSPSAETRFRARELCAVDPVRPSQIIAITFTNKAANELKERLERMLGAGADDIWAMTFHSACVRILRREIDKLGYDRSFAIHDTADSSSLMRRILKDLDVEDRDFPHRTVLGYISRAKDDMIAAEEFYASAENSGDMRRKIIGRLYIEYSNRMKTSNALDFDDLILLTVRLFIEYPDVLARYQKRFSYVLVDEYQDTNQLQYLLVSKLAGGHGNICVVGDDDQSIYKFRGATIENIMNFENQFHGARVIRLEQNYRSTGLILNAAGDVICHNTGRKGKKLWTEKDAGLKPALHIKSDERDEARFVAETIIVSASEGRRWQDHAVLYRMNAQSNQLEAAFKRAAIPYRVYGGTGFYERSEIKDMLAYLCLIHNPFDDVRLLRVINTPPRGIGQATIARLADVASETNEPIFRIIRDSKNYASLQSSAGRLNLFADMIDELRALAAIAPLDEVYESLLSRTGYIHMLEAKNYDEGAARIENVNELKTNIINFMNDNGGSLFDFLCETALYTDLDKDDQSTDRVMMMTMHSAKGLEFDTVIIVGAEEGLFPSSRSIGEPDEIEEERRLCYVAMTRARRRLMFTCARQRMLFGKTSSSQPSRFLGEISAENLDTYDLPISFGYEFFDTTGFASASGHYTPSPQIGRRQGNSRGESSGRYQSYPNTGTTASGRGGRLRGAASGSAVPGDNSPVAYKEGDSVEHTAFGRGIITKITPAGGDALLEIAFSQDGVKRLLMNSASRYMVKAETGMESK